MEIHRIDPELIVVGHRQRKLDDAKVASLAESFAKIGQQAPISVWAPADDIHLVAGHHRLAAAKLLGWAEVLCILVEMDETDRLLWEIAENLHRSELTVQERADHVAQWLRLTEAREVSRHVDAKPRAGRPVGGVRAAARELGLSEADARRAVKIAGITPEARAAADEAGLDTQKARLEIAKAPPEKQVEKVAEIRHDRRVIERQVASLMAAWNKAAPAAREEFLRRIGVAAAAATDAHRAAAQVLLECLQRDRLGELLHHFDMAGCGVLADLVRRGAQ